MDDLISRNEAIKAAFKICPEKTEPGSLDEYGVTVLCAFVDVVLKQLPAVNAASVVRCRECQHRGSNKICVKLLVGTKDSFFCAFGKRREE